ncbi:hypothetical protein [Oceanicoccus sp. KOV_DT_Chl]|uniref:hypothetical protein n=1 Tax=Oceanicoccus sp. KOV_DT_Chl TaxID=1904639 RepID=UPI000C7DD075|nr:hypothetical protein [Oceanicoccus sp. KOV_DT_Chl]
MDKATLFHHSQPIDPIAIAANYFSLDCLELSFQLLRDNHPATALRIQNLIAEQRLQHINNAQDKLIALDLDVYEVSDIVSIIAQQAEIIATQENKTKTEMIIVHQTLLDWLLYAQSFLADIDLLSIHEPKL